MIFADPYLNTDAGTMSPFEHGEVFVLDDGGEVVFVFFPLSSRVFIVFVNRLDFCSNFTHSPLQFIMRTLFRWTWILETTRDSSRLS